jgi:hypothetical protein
LSYYGFGVLPTTGLFDREKALNIQKCAMEHARRGYPLRANYLDILANIHKTLDQNKNISYAVMEGDMGYQYVAHPIMGSKFLPFCHPRRWLLRADPDTPISVNNQDTTMILDEFMGISPPSWLRSMICPAGMSSGSLGKEKGNVEAKPWITFFMCSKFGCHARC